MGTFFLFYTFFDQEHTYTTFVKSFDNERDLQLYCKERLTFVGYRDAKRNIFATRRGMLGDRPVYQHSGLVQDVPLHTWHDYI